MTVSAEANDDYTITGTTLWNLCVDCCVMCWCKSFMFFTQTYLPLIFHSKKTHNPRHPAVSLSLSFFFTLFITQPTDPLLRKIHTKRCPFCSIQGSSEAGSGNRGYSQPRVFTIGAHPVEQNQIRRYSKEF